MVSRSTSPALDSTLCDPQSVIKELEVKIRELADQILGPSSTISHQSPFAPQSSIKQRIDSFESGILLSTADSKENMSSKLPAVPLPSFDGTDLDGFLKEFDRWMRLTGMHASSAQMQLDWLVQACTSKKNLLKKLWKSKVILSMYSENWKICFQSWKTTFR